MVIMTKYFFLTIFVFFSFSLFAQVKISGFVKDAQTGEMLIGATVVEMNTNNGIATNSNGYFSLLVNDNQIQVSFIGYKQQLLKCNNDTVVTLHLEAGQELDEIKVFGQGHSKFNITTLTTKQMLSIPAIGGKPDVMKTLQLMPGIQSQAEGTSLINVRGGNPGENLYLIDDVPLLYVNHLGGFMSVFNPDMINSMEVYKGGFPPKYGGKLSSVMAITQREGNNKEWLGNFGIGLTDASFSVEGPLVTEKASIIITGRKTFTEPLMMAASVLADQDFITFYGFHDINGKITYRPDTRNSFHLNFYQGDDYLKFYTKPSSRNQEKAKIINTWGNWLLSGRWSRVVAPRLFVNNIISVTNYRLKVQQEFHTKTKTDTIDFSSLYLSKVNDLSLRSDWQFKVAKNYNLEFGAKLTMLNHIPNKIEDSNNPGGNDYEQIRSFENTIYINNRLTLFSFIDANIGFTGMGFINNDFTDYNIEPRLSLNTRINNMHSLNITYQRVNQFAHLLFTSGAIMNNEIWVPSDESIPPSWSVQYSAGWKGSFAKNMFDSEINIYFKELNELATYKEGYSNLLGDGGWRNKIETGGFGESKGIEFLLRKNEGAWTGFIGYSYSKTIRKYDGINKGEEYVFDYDRPHSASINVSREFNAKWSLSASWVYQTGLPYTPVLGRHYYPDGYGNFSEILIYGERNSERMKDYHRLDLGFVCKKKTKKGRNSEWNFSVYNVYNRHNPNSYYYASEKNNYKTFDYEGNYQSLKLYQMSFFPIIPTVSYKVFFEK